MKNLFILLLGILTLTEYCNGQKKTKAKAFQPHVEKPGEKISIQPSLGTIFPISIDGGLAIIYRQIQIGLSLGMTPTPYYQFIGAVAATTGGNKAYYDVMDAAFTNNRLYRANIQYFFTPGEGRWFFGFDFISLESHGSASISQVLEAATGQDYSNLKNFLESRNQQLDLAISSKILMSQFFFGYQLRLQNKLGINVLGGYVQALNAEVDLKTETQIDTTTLGASLLSEGEKALNQILIDYGVFPSIGISVFYDI